MEAFLSFIKYNYFLVVYGITWFISVKYYKKYFDTVLKFFPIIIAYTFFTELLGFLVGTSESFAFFEKFESSNDIIYNLYGLVFFSYFHYIFWNLTLNRHLKAGIVGLWIISFLGYVINAFFQNPLTQVFYYATSFSALLLVITVTFYWKDKRKSWFWKMEKYNLMTYISIALFVFYLIFPIVFLPGFLNYELWAKYHLGVIHKSLIIFMYGVFCYGFYYSRRKAFH